MTTKMSIAEFSRFVEKLKDEEIGTYCSGGYGKQKREWFIAMVKSLARAQARGEMRVV